MHARMHADLTLGHSCEVAQRQANVTTTRHVCCIHLHDEEPCINLAVPSTSICSSYSTNLELFGTAVAILSKVISSGLGLCFC
jgi:hypothetical protein